MDRRLPNLGEHRRVSAETVDDTVVVVLRGDLDLSVAAEISDFIEHALRDSQQVAFDLTAVTYLDSSVLGAIMQGARRSKAERKRIAVVRPPRRVFEMFEMLALEEFLAFFETRELALRYLAATA